MVKRLRLLWLWWKTRKWRPQDHEECLSFMGPCCSPSPSCTERQEYLRLKAELAMPSARLLSEWEPRRRRAHTTFNCQMIGHCHECDEYPPPCCPECRYFGPCSECEERRRPKDCGDNRCQPCRTKYRVEGEVRGEGWVRQGSYVSLGKPKYLKEDWDA